MPALPRPEDLQSKLDDPALRQIFSTAFIEAHNALDRYAVAIGLHTLARLGISDELAREPDIAALLARRGLHPQGLAPLAWLRRKLEWDGDLAGGGGGGWSWTLPRRMDDPERLYAAAIGDFPSAEPAFAIFRLLGAQTDAYYREGKSGEDILFGLATLPLWFEYFSNDNLVYGANNAVGAEAVLLVLADPPSTAPARVLEIGGGAGSAALALFDLANERGRLAEIGDYRFTELAPSFLRRGQRTLQAVWGARVALTGAKLDLDAPFAEQGVPPGSCDIVYLVNTLHVAQDLARTLAEIRTALAPGGALVFAECLRPLPGQPIYPEYLFDHLRGFREVRVDAETRPNHGFLTPTQWRQALARAGFSRTTTYPDLDRLNEGTPYFYTGAVIAWR